MIVDPFKADEQKEKLRQYIRWTVYVLLAVIVVVGLFFPEDTDEFYTETVCNVPTETVNNCIEFYYGNEGSWYNKTTNLDGLIRKVHIMASTERHLENMNMYFRFKECN